MKRHELARIVWTRLKQVNAYTAMAFPPIVAGLLFLLFVYWGVERQGGYEPATGWGNFIPKWLTYGLASALLALAAAGIAFVTYQKATKHPTVANGSTGFGIAITATLSWATRQCDWTGGVVAGLTAAGTIVILAAVAGYVTGRTEPGITGQQPFGEPQGGKEGLIYAMRVGMAIFMGLVALIAALPYLELSSSARPLLLAIAGIGLTSATSVSSKHSLKNYMAIGGMIASLVGAYVQLDQAITATGNGDISARDVIVAVSILWFAPFTILAASRHRVLRIFFVPALAAIIALFIMILVTVIPAILIVSGCNVGGSLQYMVAGVVSTTAIAAGVATFVISTLGLIFRRRETQNVDG